MSIKALVIDDDIELQKLLEQYFSNYEIITKSHFEGTGALEKIKSVKPDIIILDIMMPGKDGMEVLREIRPEINTPVIMLTARGDDTDRIIGLEMGADDYLAKPFNPRELVARIKAIIRRNDSGYHGKVKKEEVIDNDSVETLVVDGVMLDFNTYRVKKGNNEEELSLTEFKLLKALMERAGVVLSRNELLDYARGKDFEAFDRSVDMHISKLRNKLKSIGDKKGRIKTSWGTGYMFLKLLN